MDIWFEYALGLSEAIFSAKLNEYEEATASLVVEVAGVHDDGNGKDSLSFDEKEDSMGISDSAHAVESLMSAMELNRPIRAPFSKNRSYIDDVHEEAEWVFSELDAPYTVLPSDAVALHTSSLSPALVVDAEGPRTLAKLSTNQLQLLYGELTSVGIRQLHTLSIASTSTVTENRVEGTISTPYYRPSPASLSPSPGAPRGSTAVIVGLDIGSGNGRLLYEWSRLAAATCRKNALGRPASGRDEVVPLQREATATSAASGGDGEREVGGDPLDFPVSNAPAWRGWLGVGVELLPSRMRTAFRALVPHYVRLVRGLGSAGTPRYDPVPPQAIAVSATASSPQSSNNSYSHSFPCGRSPVDLAALDHAPLPAATVLLCEDDILAPSLLTNETLCRFPIPSLTTSFISAGGGLSGSLNPSSIGSVCSSSSTASSVRAPGGRANYYRLARVEGGAPLNGSEKPHLVVFCCGLGFDEPFVRQLCQQLENMLLRRLGDGEVDESVAASGLPSARTSALMDPVCSPTITTFESPQLMKHLRNRSSNAALSDGGAEADGAPDTQTLLTVNRHWESVTCVLLLRPMDVHAPNFPLFRYARQWYDAKPIPVSETASVLERGCLGNGTSVPFLEKTGLLSDNEWDVLMASVIQESAVWTTTLETSWMAEAPAWVLRFRF